MRALTISFLICLNAAWCSSPQLKGTLSLGQFSNGFCKFQQSCWEFWKIINHTNERLYLLLACRWWHFRYHWYLALGLACSCHWYRFPQRNLLLSPYSVTCHNWDECCFFLLFLTGWLVLCHGLCGFVDSQQPWCCQLWWSHYWSSQSTGRVSFGIHLQLLLSVMPNGIMIYRYLPNSILKDVR